MIHYQKLLGSCQQVLGALLIANCAFILAQIAVKRRVEEKQRLGEMLSWTERLYLFCNVYLWKVTLLAIVLVGVAIATGSILSMAK